MRGTCEMLYPTIKMVCTRVFIVVCVRAQASHILWMSEESDPNSARHISRWELSDIWAPETIRGVQ